MYGCVECDWRTRGDLDDLLGHVRGQHCLDMRLGGVHFGYCNEDRCLRKNGHGRRMNGWEGLISHLKCAHGIEIAHSESLV